MTSDRRSIAFDAAMIFILALGIRLVFALSLPSDDTVFWDQPNWDYAKHFSEGSGFWMSNPYSDSVDLPRVYAFRPPLFPLIWGSLFRWTHGAYAPIRVGFAVLGAGACAIAFLAGLEITRKRAAALLAGILCAFYPPLIWHSVHLMTEPLFIFLSALCIYLAFIFRRSGLLRWAILAGITAGLAALTRSMLIGFLPLLAVWIWWSRRKLGRAWAGAVLFGAAALLTLAPWIIRNAVVLHAFVPSTTDAGHGFYVANNPRSLDDPRGFCVPQDWSFMLKPGETSISEVEASRRLMHVAGDYLLSHPRMALSLMARRFVTLWRFYPHPEFVSRRQVLVYALTYMPLFPLILFGLWRAHRRRDERWMDVLLVDALILYTTAIHTVFLAMLRYREPLMPYLLIFAAVGLMEIIGMLRRGPAKSPAVQPPPER